MNCAHDYCLYNKGFKCTLEEVNIDSMGLCDECIIVRFDADVLEAEKERQLNKLEERAQSAGSRTHHS